MTHLGRDYSSFQGNLTDADCEGIDFGYVKATEGDQYKNPYAVQQCAMLRKHNVAVGYYHFFSPNVSVGDQLHNFHIMAASLGKTLLPLALDSETAEGWPQLATQMMDFAMGVESWKLYVPNTKAIFYVNVNFYKNLAGFPWGRWVWLADPNPGAPHEPCLILQGAPRPVSSADAKVIDPDTFMGNDIEWLAFVGYVPPTPTPTPVPDPLQLPLVPGFNLAPGIPEVAIIGQLQGGGVFKGHNATGGVTVYAGVGSPTTWLLGQNLKDLPAGTPLAVATADIGNVTADVVTEQL